jgi:hypothetical protein
MTNQWLAEQGLVSIKPKRSEIEFDEKRARKRRPRQTLWVSFHYPSASRHSALDIRHSPLVISETRMSGGVGSGS